jgi:hypothetical protein
LIGITDGLYLLCKWLLQRLKLALGFGANLPTPNVRVEPTAPLNTKVTQTSLRRGPLRFAHYEKLQKSRDIRFAKTKMTEARASVILNRKISARLSGAFSFSQLFSWPLSLPVFSPLSFLQLSWLVFSSLLFWLVFSPLSFSPALSSSEPHYPRRPRAPPARVPLQLHRSQFRRLLLPEQVLPLPLLLPGPLLRATRRSRRCRRIHPSHRPDHTASDHRSAYVLLNSELRQHTAKLKMPAACGA